MKRLARTWRHDRARSATPARTPARAGAGTGSTARDPAATTCGSAVLGAPAAAFAALAALDAGAAALRVLGAPAAAFAALATPASVAFGLALSLIVSPSIALAADPPCSSLFPSAGPGGVDLKGACVANEVVQGYVAPSSSSDTLWAAGLILAASWMAAVVAYAAWRWLSRNGVRRLAPTAPVALWLCEACRSFNPGDATICYRCHLVRPADPPTVDATVPPRWDQRFGRPPDL